MIGSIPQPGDPHFGPRDIYCADIKTDPYKPGDQHVGVTFTFETVDPYNGRKGLADFSKIGGQWANRDTLELASELVGRHDGERLLVGFQSERVAEHFWRMKYQWEPAPEPYRILKRAEPAPARTTRRTYTLAPAVPMYVKLAAILAVAIAAAMLLPVKVFGQTTQPATAPTTRPVTFEIGAWQVPVEDVAKWKARGVDTFVGHVDYGGRMTKAEWERRVGEAGGRFITYPGDHVIEEGKQTSRAGFLQLDEPDMSNHVDKPGYTPADYRRQYERASGTGLPVYLTCGAVDNQWYDGFPKPAKTDGSKYGHRAASGGWYAYCDRAGFDWYIYTNGRNEAIGFPVIERCLDRMNEWGGGKPIYLFVETCSQGKPYAMTADQWESQVMHAANYCKAKGYKVGGIFYFSHVVFPYWKSFDGTSAEVAERMPVVNARLREMFGPTLAIPATLPTVDPLTALRADLETARGQIVELKALNATLAADAAAKGAVIDAVRAALPATRPAGAGQ